MTPMKLIDAVVENDVETVVFLLADGADPNEALDEDCVTALHVAAQNNAVEIADALLYAGANPYAKTRPDETTPLDVACLHESLELIALLASYHYAYEICSFLLSNPQAWVAGSN